MKILIIDDHELIRAGLRLALAPLGAPQVLEAANASEAMALIEGEEHLDLILLDLFLPDRSGMDLLEDTGRKRPEVPVIVLSAHDDRDTIAECLHAGAVGFITKQSVRTTLVSAIQHVLAGGLYMPPHVGSIALAAREHPVPSIEITERQRDVLELMVQGLPNKGICRELGLAVPTVKGHVTAILRALGVNSRTQAVLAATQRGLVRPKP